MARRFLVPIAAVFFAAFCLTAAFSQVNDQQRRVQQPAVPPAMFDEEGESARPLDLASVQIEAQIIGYAARTRMTMVFYNPGSRAVAGNLYFPLPSQATVSGYALDIKGVMVDGVAVERTQGRQAYKTVMARGIDPGLVEWTRGNVFKTRVFPVAARGTRTIRIDYTSPIEADAAGAYFALPLDFTKKLGSFKMSIEVIDTKVKPEITETSIKGLQFTSWKSGFRTEAALKDAIVSQDLVLRLPPVSADPLSVDRGKDGKTYAAWYGLRSELLAKAGKAPSSSAAPKKLTMYWDASFSREKSDHQKIFEALNAYFARYPQSLIQVSAIVFRDAPEAPRDFTVKNGRAEELLQFLASLPYDGATRFQDLPAAKGSDLAILVTDGLTTLGGPAFEAGVPVFALAVERSFDAARLAALSNASGGALLRLDNPSEAAMRIGAASFRFLGARITEGKAESIIPISATALLDASSGDLAGVIGILGSKTVKATLRFGYSESTAVEIPVTWEDTGVSSESAPKDSSQSRAVQESLWASSELARLLALPDADSGATLSKVEALGRDYNLVTPRTSLIVLESLEQYVEFRIRPPESLPGMRSEWAMAIASIDKEQIDKRKAAIENLVEEWKVRVAWWEKKFEYPANFKYKEPAAEKSAEALGPSGDERMRLADAAPASAADGFEESAEGDDKAKKDSSEGGDAGPSISIQAWNPDTPYIKKLDAARGGASGKLGEAAAKEAYAIYLTERKQNERAPGFYFDVGDWFEKAGRMDLATRIWSTLAELDLESPNLLRVLAARLVQAGKLPAAKDIYEQVAVMRPEEPHSYRDLALTLTKMGEHGKAVDLLYTVALGTYPQWPGIELIALNELNGILPKAKAAQQKTVEIDPRLVKVLDSDVRITMSWDTDLSDMDLWVIEPSGEKAYYGHQQTTIGGLVSQDITTGYGPEEYTVRKAMKGVYSIKANYYGNQNPEVSGTVTVQVEVITDWGRKTEKRQSLVLRLKGQSDVYTVGEIKF